MKQDTTIWIENPFLSYLTMEEAINSPTPPDSSEGGFFATRKLKPGYAWNLVTYAQGPPAWVLYFKNPKNKEFESEAKAAITYEPSRQKHIGAILPPNYAPGAKLTTYSGTLEELAAAIEQQVIPSLNQK